MDNAKQMEFLFEEGGIADDGMDRDPVSGNEVPAGSLAEEVRDDIPAQLSEGEYVVPADVVRYYGVKFFEDLRGQAKEGLGEMEEDGRIGGEPVDVEGDDIDLTDEEMAELESITGMAMGGFVPQQDMQQPRGFFPGGLATQATVPEEAANPPADTQVATSFPQFGPGFSFMGGASDVTVPVGPSRNVTLYGPNGEVVNLILPVQQTLYDDYISQGYATEPVSKVETPSVQSTSRRDGDTEQQGPEQDRMSSLDRALSDVDMDNPLGAGKAALEGKSKLGQIAGGVIGGLIAGPIGAALGGQLGKATQETSSLAEAAVNSEIAGLLGYDNSELNSSINDRLSKMNGLSKTFAENAVQRAKDRALSAITDVDAPQGFALTRDKFVSDEAFAAAMQSTARPGMTYDPSTGGYTRSPTVAAPTSSLRPVSRPTNLVASSGSDKGRDTVVGGYEGEFGYYEGPTAPEGFGGGSSSSSGSRGGSSGGSSRGGASSSPGAANEPEGGREGRYKGGLMGNPKGRKKKK
jgi:hypothetical protein